MNKLKMLEDIISQTRAEVLKELVKTGSFPKSLPLEARRICIPWSAGSGKTSTIIEFIAKYWEEGIIYSTWTIEELERVKEGILKLNPDIAKYVCCFHSKADNWEEINDDPQKLTKFRVILVTDVSLLTIPPSVLLNQNNFFSETRPSNNVRGWIILDEKPTLQRKLTIKENHIRPHLKVLSNVDPITTDDVLDYYQTQSKDVITALEDVSYQLTNSKYLEGNYEEKPIKYYDPVQRQLVVENKKVKTVNKNSIKARTTKLGLELIYSDMKNLAELNELDPSIQYGVRFADINKFYDITELDNQATTIINFDGTGDIILSKAKDWSIARNDFPYNFKDYGKIEILEEYVPIKRNYTSTSRNTDLVEYGVRIEEVKENLISIVNYILQSISEGQKPLAVTWKDISSLVVHSGEDQIVYDEKLSMNDQIEKELEKLGYIRGVHYYLTYWMSGKTRGTNEFMDATEFLAFEPLYLSNQALSELNISLKPKEDNPITAKDLFLAEFIQAIYRTQIRCNKPVTVKITENLIDIIKPFYEYLKLEDTNFSASFSLSLFKLMLNKKSYEDLIRIYEANKIVDYKNLIISFNSTSELSSICPRKKVYRLTNYQFLFKNLVKVGFKIILAGEDITSKYLKTEV